jgi:hypothetical protein
LALVATTRPALRTPGKHWARTLFTGTSGRPIRLRPPERAPSTSRACLFPAAAKARRPPRVLTPRSTPRRRQLRPPPGISRQCRGRSVTHPNPTFPHRNRAHRTPMHHLTKNHRLPTTSRRRIPKCRAGGQSRHRIPKMEHRIPIRRRTARLNRSHPSHTSRRTLRIRGHRWSRVTRGTDLRPREAPRLLPVTARRHPSRTHQCQQLRLRLSLRQCRRLRPVTACHRPSRLHPRRFRQAMGQWTCRRTKPRQPRRAKPRRQLMRLTNPRRQLHRETATCHRSTNLNTRRRLRQAKTTRQRTTSPNRSPHHPSRATRPMAITRRRPSPRRRRRWLQAHIRRNSAPGMLSRRSPDLVGYPDVPSTPQTGESRLSGRLPRKLSRAAAAPIARQLHGAATASTTGPRRPHMLTNLRVSAKTAART